MNEHRRRGYRFLKEAMDADENPGSENTAMQSYSLAIFELEKSLLDNQSIGQSDDYTRTIFLITQAKDRIFTINTKNSKMSPTPFSKHSSTSLIHSKTISQTKAQKTLSNLKTNTQKPTSIPKTNTQKTTSIPKTNIQKTTSIPKTNTQKTTAIPKTNTQKTTSIPKTNTQKTTSIPKTNTQKTTSIPKTNTQKTTSIPKTNTQKTTSISKTNTQKTTSIPKTNTLKTPFSSSKTKEISLQIKSNCEYEKCILESIITESNHRLNDVIGLDNIKKILKEIVILPSLRPDIFQGLRSPSRGLLLFGPPGNGKTFIAKALASETDMTFFNITASSLTSKFVGDGEKLVKSLFKTATKYAPSLIFIDEIDSILRVRQGSEHEASRRLKTEFFASFDGSDNRLLTIAATNLPYELDEAALRRFSKRIYVPLPSMSLRESILSNLLLKNGLSSLSKAELQYLSGKATEGYSASDLTNLAKEAALEPIRELSLDEITIISSTQIRKITLNDFKKALVKIRPSLSEKSCQIYEDWNFRYGDIS